MRSTRTQCRLTIRSTGHFAAVRVRASFHSRPNPAYRKMPVSFTLGCTNSHLPSAAHKSQWIESVACCVLREPTCQLRRLQPTRAVAKFDTTVHACRGQSANPSAGPGRNQRTCSRTCVATCLEIRAKLALRASVLRRAVSQLARPMLHLSTASDVPGRSKPEARASFRSVPPSLSGTVGRFRGKVGVSWACQVQPNNSLNRTFCGRPGLGFISFSPKPGLPQNAG